MKTAHCLIGSLCLAALSASAGIFDNVLFRAATDKANPAGYAVGEKISLTFTLAQAPKEVFSGAYAIDWRRWGDDGKEAKGRLPLDGKTPLTVTTALDRPGGVFVEAFVVNAADGKRVRRDKRALNTHSWEESGLDVQFIGGALVAPDQIKPAHAEPADFDAFWARQKRRLADVPATVLERKEVTPNDQTVARIWAIKVACAGPRPVTGYLTVPRNAKPKSLKATCFFHGYGTSIQGAPADGPDDQITFNVNAHGYDLGRDKAYYDAFNIGIRTSKDIYGFSAWQNEYPEGCYFNGMALRLMRAFDFVRSLPEWDGKTLIAQGGSQGGLQSMWAAGLVEDLTVSRPEVPWCADLGPDAVPGRVAPGWRISWTPGIAYYDCVNHAKRAKGRVEITRAGLGDTCCMPSSIAALYNNLPADRRSIVWVQGSKHGYVPPMPNQSVSLPSGKTVAPYQGSDVFTGDKLPTK